MKVEVEFDEFIKGEGFSVPIDQKKAKIRVEINMGAPEISIEANKEGLMGLGTTLIKMAQSDVWDNYDIHFDQGVLLTNDSEGLVFVRTDTIEAESLNPASFQPTFLTNLKNKMKEEGDAGIED